MAPRRRDASVEPASRDRRGRATEHGSAGSVPAPPRPHLRTPPALRHTPHRCRARPAARRAPEQGGGGLSRAHDPSGARRTRRRTLRARRIVAPDRDLGRRRAAPTPAPRLPGSAAGHRRRAARPALGGPRPRQPPRPPRSRGPAALDADRRHDRPGRRPPAPGPAPGPARRRLRARPRVRCREPAAAAPPALPLGDRTRRGSGRGPARGRARQGGSLDLDGRVLFSTRPDPEDQRFDIVLLQQAGTDPSEWPATLASAGRLLRAGGLLLCPILEAALPQNEGTRYTALAGVYHEALDAPVRSPETVTADLVAAGFDDVSTVTTPLAALVAARWEPDPAIDRGPAVD